MSILIKPIITEKATLQNDKGVYIFSVSVKANKIQIKQAVEQAYGVTVTGVRTLIYGPKSSIRYTNKGVQYGKTASVKRAVVSVKEGETIDFYSNN